MGILEYLSLSNDKLQNVQEEDKYSFIDDLSLLELINLTNIGMQSYNVKQHVPTRKNECLHEANLFLRDLPNGHHELMHQFSTVAAPLEGRA